MVYSRLSSPEMSLVATGQDDIQSLIDSAKTSMYALIPKQKLPANDSCATYWLSAKIIKIITAGKTDAKKALIDVYRCISDTVHSVVEPWSQALAIIGTEMSKLYYEVCMHKAIGLRESGRCPATRQGLRIKYNFQMTDTSEIIKNLSTSDPELMPTRYDAASRTQP